MYWVDSGWEESWMGHTGHKNWVDAAECGQDTAMLSKRRSIGEPLSWLRCDAIDKQVPDLTR